MNYPNYIDVDQLALEVIFMLKVSYYSGITSEQLAEAFEHYIEQNVSDNSCREYLVERLNLNQ